MNADEITTLITRLWPQGINPTDYLRVITLVTELGIGSPRLPPRPAPQAQRPVAIPGPVARKPGRPVGSKNKPKRAGRKAAAPPGDVGANEVHRLLAQGPQPLAQLMARAGSTSVYQLIKEAGAGPVGKDENGSTLYGFPATETGVQDVVQ
jgi:hypothetical protein